MGSIEYVPFLIRTTAKISLKSEVDKLLKQKKAPKGQQFWIALPKEKKQGIVYEEMMQMVGFLGYKWLDDAASWCGTSSIEYLEELSGWKAIKVGGAIR